MRLSRVRSFLDETLAIGSFPGDSSLNGLQVEASRDIGKVALAVDACAESISAAARRGAGLLIVHHGLFWNGPAPLTGMMARRVGKLLQKKVSLYAAHLPLDCHPEIGNNAQLAGALGISPVDRFGVYAGVEIGLCGALPQSIRLEALKKKLGRLLDARVQAFSFGPAVIKKAGIVSGGGAGMTRAAAEAGCDVLITGESSHSSYHIAKEHGINVIFAGHYATETLGVKALGELLERKTGLKTFFIDLPTGL